MISKKNAKKISEYPNKKIWQLRYANLDDLPNSQLEIREVAQLDRARSDDSSQAALQTEYNFVYITMLHDYEVSQKILVFQLYSLIIGDESRLVQ